MVIAALVLLTDDPDAWQLRGNCQGIDPEVFFPHDGPGVDRAKALCAGCPVIEDCLAHALSLPERYGVWGGASEKERRRIRRRQRMGR